MLQKGLGTLALVSMVYGNVGSYICRYTLKVTVVFAGSITPETIRIRDALRLPAGILGMTPLARTIRRYRPISQEW